MNLVVSPSFLYLCGKKVLKSEKDSRHVQVLVRSSNLGIGSGTIVKIRQARRAVGSSRLDRLPRLSHTPLQSTGASAVPIPRTCCLR